MVVSGWIRSAEKVEVAPMLGVVAGYNWNSQITIDPPGYFNNRGKPRRAFADQHKSSWVARPSLHNKVVGFTLGSLLVTSASAPLLAALGCEVRLPPLPPLCVGMSGTA